MAVIYPEPNIPWRQCPSKLALPLDPLRLQRAEEIMEREFEKQFWGDPDDQLDPESKALRAREE